MRNQRAWMIAAGVVLVVLALLLTVLLVSDRPRPAPTAATGTTAPAVEEAPGRSWTGVDVVAATLSPGGSTLIAMATNQGTGVYLGYDLVRWPSSTGRPTVAAHRGDLSHGFFRARQTSGGPVLDDYGANYDDGAPNCCPNRYDHARIVFRDGVFLYLVRERLPASAVGR